MYLAIHKLLEIPGEKVFLHHKGHQIMPSLFPMMAAPEDFRPGDPVRKFVTEWNVTPYCGIVTHIVPATNKVWVQWPIEHSQESPECLVKVNPAVFGLPTVLKDKGYDSYEKQLSEKTYGRIPKGASEQDKMAIRIAHTFATDVVGKLVDDIVIGHDQGLSDVQTYYRIFPKYASICSDYIIRSSIKKIYAASKGDGFALHHNMMQSLKDNFDSDSFTKYDAEAAIYWYATKHHEGPGTDLHSISEGSKFKPNPTHKSVEDEGALVEAMYKHLEDQFGKKRQASGQRSQLIKEVLWVIDDSGKKLGGIGYPVEKLKDAYLVGWQTGFEPSVVAIISDMKLSESDADEIATEYLKKIKWLKDDKEADYVSMPSRSSKTGKMKSMTWGTMPTYEEFVDAFDEEVDRATYRITNDPTGYDGEYNPAKLYDMVEKLKDSKDEKEQDLASSIMQTLGFEWI